MQNIQYLLCNFFFIFSACLANLIVFLQTYYLSSERLFGCVRRFWALRRPVCAVCHGVLVLVRAGVLEGFTTTTVPQYMGMFLRRPGLYV